MSQNFIKVTDGIRMKRKSLERLFQVSEDEDDVKECGGLLTMRQIESNIDKIMNNFVLEFDLSRVVVRGGCRVDLMMNDPMTQIHYCVLS